MSKIIKYITAFIIFLIASIYITFPLIFHLGDMTVGLGDELVITWIQNWVIHVIMSGNITTLFDANIYFPYHNTLAYSDLFITSSIFSIIPLQLIDEPIGTFNFTLISSLALLGFSIFLFSYYFTKDFLVSLFSGIMVIFSPAVLDKSTHLQILAVQWVPLSILFFLLFIKTSKSRFLLISLIFFLLQTYNSFLPGYFIIFSNIIILIYNFIFDKKKTVKIITLKNILFLLIGFSLLIPIIIPYYQVSKEFNYTRDIRDTIHFALQPEDLLYSSTHSRFSFFLNNLPINKYSQNNEFKAGNIGIIFSILTLFAIYYFFRYFNKNNKIINSLSIIGLFGLILSLGPVLHLGRRTIHEPFIIPLPYTLLYYILPGFQGFRNSARWEMLFIICFSIVIALVLYRVLKKYSAVSKTIIYFVLIIACIAENNFPMKFESVIKQKDFPKIYSWLSSTSQNSAVILLPIYNWDMPYASEEIKRDYFSISHWHKTVNGYSGFSPPPWQRTVYEVMQDFPSDNILDKFKKIGVSYIIIRKSEYDLLHNDNYKVKDQRLRSGNEIISLLSKNNKVKLIKIIDDDFIFRL